MATVRSGTGVISLLKEDSFLVKDGSFEGSKLQANAWDISNTFVHAPIENSAVRVTDFGKHEAGFGLAHTGSTFGCSAYAVGTGTPAGDTETPTANFLSHLVGSSLGVEPVLTVGTTAKAAITNTTTSVTVTVPAGVAVGQFVAHTLNGLTYVRPIIDVTGAGDDVAVLSLALPIAPLAGSVLQGQINFQATEDAMAHVLQGDLLKRNTTTAAEAGQMYEFFGAVGNLTLPEVGVADAQTLSFEHMVSAFTRYNQKTRIAPVSSRPSVAAGGEFLLAKFGNTAGLPLKFLNIGCTVGRTYVPDPRANDEQGIGGWVLTDQDTSITCTVHDDQAMPTGFSAANFPASFKEGGAENRYHLLASFGNKVAGKIFVVYFPCIQLTGEPEDTDVNGLQAWKLTFSLVSGLPANGVSKIRMAQI